MSVLQKLTLAFDLSRPQVRRLLASHTPPGFYRVGGRGHWRVKGPLTKGRLERIRRAWKRKSARIYHWRLWEPDEQTRTGFQNALAKLGEVDRRMADMFRGLNDPRILAATTGIELGLAMRDGDGAEKESGLSDEDFDKPIAAAIDEFRNYIALAIKRPALAQLALAVRKVANSRREANRVNVAAQMKMPFAEHKAKYPDDLLFKARKLAAPKDDAAGFTDIQRPTTHAEALGLEVRPATNENAAKLLNALRSLYRRGRPDTETNLAVELGLTLQQFRRRYSPDEINEAYELFEADDLLETFRMPPASKDRQ